MTKDWAGLKFKIMRELGDDTDITFKHIKNDQVSFYRRRHEVSDGLGAFAALRLKLYGVDEDIPHLIAKKPLLLVRLWLALRHVWRQRKRAYLWQPFINISNQKRKGYGYVAFSQDETNALNDYCKQQKINTTALFLATLDEIIAELFLQVDQEKVWMVPVNIRSVREAKSLTGNFVTTLSVFVKRDLDARDIYQQMRSMLKSGLIWGGEIVANSPKYIGEEKLRRMATRGLSSPYIGLLTNLGSWRQPDDSKWVLIAPASRYTPIACSLIEVNGRLSFCCQVHAGIGDETVAKKIADQLLDQLGGHIALSSKAQLERWDDVATIELY